VSEEGRPQFSKDGGRLFFGIAAAPRAEPKDAPEPIKVDIWNWNDSYLQPMQKAQADEDKKRTLMCVMHLGPKEKKFVALASADVPDIVLSEDAKVALGSSDLPYRQLVSWDRGYEDNYLVDLADGSKKKVLEKSLRGHDFGRRELSPLFQRRRPQLLRVPRCGRKDFQPDGQARCQSRRRNLGHAGRARPLWERRLDGRRQVGPHLRPI
jgi:hypothetical protein